MPQFELIGETRIRVRANRFKIGQPGPSGSRPLTASEAMALTRCHKIPALYAMMRTFVVPGIDTSGAPIVWLLNYGDWLIRLNNGNVAVVTDEQFNRQFRPVGG